jgi:uncharacterized membrane protein YozB (DUF420 family)
MSGSGMAAKRRARGEWTFFAIMSLVVAAVIAAGFGPSYAGSLAPPGLPWWVHLHGAAMACWILLFVAQAALVRRRALPLHRTLGYASIALVVVMVPLGIATDLLAIRRHAVPPFFTPAQMFAADLCDILLFAGLFAAALLLRRRREWHKRLLLCATVLLTWPAIGRLGPVRQFGIDMVVPISVALLIPLALVGPIHDLITRRRIHPAYLWGVGLIIVIQPLHGLLADTSPIRAIVESA